MAWPQPVCDALSFLVGSHGKAPTCMSRPVFSRGSTRQGPSLYVTPCVFSWVHMARPQPVCHALCFLVGSHGKAPACMSRPVFSRGFTWQGPSLYVTPCGPVFLGMSRPAFSHEFTWQGPSLCVTPCGPVFSREFTWQGPSLYVTP